MTLKTKSRCFYPFKATSLFKSHVTTFLLVPVSLTPFPWNLLEVKWVKYIWQVPLSHKNFLLQDVFLLIFNRCHFLSCDKNFIKILCIWFGGCHTQISNLRTKINFENTLRIVQKFGQTLNLPDYRMIFNIFGKSIFALKFNIWVWQHPNNFQKKFHKVFITE